MGSVCCVPAKEHALPSRTTGESLHRNVLYSPSWSFHWDNRGRVAGEIDNTSYGAAHAVRRNVRLEMKGRLGHERGTFSDGGSLLSFGTPPSQKSPVHEGTVANSMTPSGKLLWQHPVHIAYSHNFFLVTLGHVHSFFIFSFV